MGDYHDSYDFHQLTGLRSHGPIINLKDESGIQLGLDLLGHTYSSKNVHYYDLEVDYKPLSQVTSEDRDQMVRAFLLFVLVARQCP